MPLLGRPTKGALSSFSQKIVNTIRSLRNAHPGWGAITIYTELIEVYNYSVEEVPQVASINRYLKEQGYIKIYESSGDQPKSNNCDKKAKKPHDLWEMDAKGTVKVGGVGYQAIINIKDIKSKVHCMIFPIKVKNAKTQPSTRHYYWTLRLAFLEWGLPKRIQVDKDSVFYDNQSKSPFPKLLHLWLVGLGVELCFIDQPPPYKNATVERSHQTAMNQIIVGQHYQCWKQLFQYCHTRRQMMNEKLPNRSLQKKAALQAFPKAKHSARFYSIEKEEESIDQKAIFKYLAKYIWYRKVSNVKTISLGGIIYYLSKAKPKTQLEIKFCNRAKKLVFRNDNEQIIAKIPIKGLSIQQIMGSNKPLKSMLYKINNRRDFSL